MELSPRIRAIAEWVPQGARLADIGTDHCLLPVWLLRQGLIEYAIASDLRNGPLSAARRTAAHFGVTERISFRQCDGLEGIKPEEADTIVMAGMGGETILQILDKAAWTRQRAITFLLQPQSTVPELRGYLWEHQFCIVRERAVREGNRLYIILEVRPGTMAPLTPGELWAGKQSHDPLRGDYLQWIASVLTKILAGRRQSASANSPEYAKLEMALEEIQWMEQEWWSWNQR